jgi:hypothetical protein
VKHGKPYLSGFAGKYFAQGLLVRQYQQQYQVWDMTIPIPYTVMLIISQTVWGVFIVLA